MMEMPPLRLKREKEKKKKQASSASYGGFGAPFFPPDDDTRYRNDGNEQADEGNENLPGKAEHMSHMQSTDPITKGVATDATRR